MGLQYYWRDRTMGVTTIWESHKDENPIVMKVQGLGKTSLYSRWLDVLVFRWPCIAFPI